jgi:GT2 family glycosyltransferase
MNTMPVKYSIIIVTWNGLPLLKRFLPAAIATKHNSFEVIIADNNSTDGTKEWLSENYSDAKHVIFDKNYGYCGGNNRAIDHANGEILIFLNNDATPEENWLTHLDDILKNPQIAAVQPKIKSVNEPTKFEYAGAAGGYLDKLAYPFCAGRVFEHVEDDKNQYDTPSQIDWASGASLVIRKSVFQQLGGFDEHFEFHMEEIDLCWRIWRAGYEVWYEPKAVVYHLGGGSLSMGSPRKVYYNFRNSLAMITRNTSKSLFPTIFARLILDGVAAIKSLLSGKPKELIAIFNAHMHYYRMLRRLLKERKQLQLQFEKVTQKKKIPGYNGLIIWDYFVKGKRLSSDILPR